MNENIKRQTQSIEKDFLLLTEQGNIGFYHSCEITTIFLFDKNISKAKNFYTIAVFEEKTPTDSVHNQYITKKLIPINNRYKLGIMRYHRSIEE